MNGTVALYRMEKHFLVAQHYFRQPGAPRSACCTVESRPRLPLQRKAAKPQARPPGFSPAHGLAEAVPLCRVDVRSGVSAAPFLSPSTTRSPRPIGVTGRIRRSLAMLRTAANSRALVARAGPSYGLVGPVPLCCGGERPATG